MATFNAFLGTSNTGEADADYTLQVFTRLGASVSTTAWTWFETAGGGYVVTYPTAAPGGSYFLFKTSGGSPSTQGELSGLVEENVAEKHGRGPWTR